MTDEHPTCENCRTSDPDHGVSKRANGAILCDCCVGLLAITAPERRHRERRRLERRKSERRKEDTP